MLSAIWVARNVLPTEQEGLRPTVNIERSLRGSELMGETPMLRRIAGSRALVRGANHDNQRHH